MRADRTRRGQRKTGVQNGMQDSGEPPHLQGDGIHDTAPSWQGRVDNFGLSLRNALQTHVDGHERLEKLLESIPLGVILYGDHGEFIWANSTALRLWGIDKAPKGPHAHAPHAIWSPDTGEEIPRRDWPAQVALRERCRVEGQVLEIERPDGRRAFVKCSAMPILGANEEVHGVVSFLEDITDLSERVDFTATMQRVAQVVHTSLATDDILTCALDLASAALKAQSAGLAICIEGGWRVVYGLGDAAEMVLREFTEEELSASSAAKKSRRVHVANGTEFGNADTTGESHIPYRSALSIPLIVQDDVVGVMTFLRSTTEPFTDNQVAFARELGPTVSLGLENARLFESAKLAKKETEQELATNQVLLRSLTAINEGMDLTETLRAIMDNAAQATGVKRVTVFLYDDSGKTVRVAASQGEQRLPIGLRVAVRSIPQDIVQAFVDRKAVEFDLTRPDLSPDMVELSRLTRSVRALAVPLIRDEHMVGVMIMDEPGVHVMFGERDMEVAFAMAAQAAVAIENAQLFEAHKENARLNLALIEIDRMLHSTTDLDAMLMQALGDGGRALGAESGCIAWRNDGSGSIKIGFAYGFEEELVGLEIPEEVDRHGKLAAFTRETIAVSDVVEDHMTDQRLLDYVPAKSSIIAPLVVRDEAEATIYFHYTSQIHEFGQSEVSFVTRLASSLSLAMENAELFNEQAQRAVLSEALNTIGADINETLDFDAALDLAIPTALTALKVDWVAIIAHDGRERRIDRHWGSRPELKGRSFRLRNRNFDDLNQVVAVDDVVSHERYGDKTFTTLGITSVVCAPLVRLDEVFGNLVFSQTEGPREWKVHEIDFITALAAHLSLAAQNSAMYEEERQRARLNQALAEIDNVIYAAVNSEDIIDRGLRMGAAAIGAESASVSLRKESTWVLVHEYRLGSSMIGYTFSDDEVAYTADFRRGAGAIVFSHPPGHPEILKHRRKKVELSASLVVPLTLRNDLFGLMFFNLHRESAVFDDAQLDFAKRLGASVSLALENLRLFEAERRTVHLAETLTRVNELLLSTLSVDVILESIIAEATRGTSAHASMLLKPEGDEWFVAHSHGLTEKPNGQRISSEFSASFAAALKTKRPVFIEDVSKEPKANVRFARRFGFRSFIMTPLIAGRDLLGILFFGYRNPSSFEDKDVQFASRLSTAITLALENARLYQTERHIAETLQDTLLTMPKRIKGVDFARFYRSATVSTKVGGDFIDAFQLSARKIAISLGDVSGKGLEAASVTATVRNTIRAHAVEGLPPNLVAEKTNALLRLFTSTETFVTAFFALLDVRTGRLSYVSAGHPDTMIVSANGEVRRLETRSPVLGAFDNVPYKEGQTFLETGDMLFAYSDGLTESRGEQGMFGENRLTSLLSQLALSDPEATVAKIFSAVNRYSGGEFRDDIALLALRRDSAEALDENWQGVLDFTAPSSPIQD